MGPNWVLSSPDGPHVGPMNLAIRVYVTIRQIRDLKLLWPWWQRRQSRLDSIVRTMETIIHHDLIWHKTPWLDSFIKAIRKDIAITHYLTCFGWASWVQGGLPIMGVICHVTWAAWRLNSPETPLFLQRLVQSTIKPITPYYWPCLIGTHRCELDSSHKLVMTKTVPCYDVIIVLRNEYNI